MNFKIRETNGNYTYETIFDAYQNEIVDNRFNIVIQHCDMSDFGDANELQVVLNVENIPNDEMQHNIDALAAKIEEITNVKPVIGCSDNTSCYCYTKPWSYKEWERIVNEILKCQL